MRWTFDADRNPSQRLAGLSVMAPLHLVFTHARLRPLALSAFAYAGAQLSIGGFFVVYLTTAIGLPLVQAGLVFALMQVGGICGRIFWGAIAGRLVAGRHLLMALGLMMAAALAMAAAITPAWPVTLIVLVGIVLGATSLGWNGVSLAEIAARAPEGKIIEATGGVQFVMFAGIVIVPPSFGAIVTLTHSFSMAFLAIAALAMSAGLYLARRPRERGTLPH
jgi:Na+/melibiose symporter-like transporter